MLERRARHLLATSQQPVASLLGACFVTYFLIAVGSALGGVARHWCSLAVATATGSAFPWGTMTVNVVGSALIGVALGVVAPDSRWQVPEVARNFVNHFFMIGVLGGFTTFSSFSLQTLSLMREQHWGQAGANVLLSVVLCLLAVALGYWLIAVVGRS